MVDEMYACMCAYQAVFFFFRKENDVYCSVLCGHDMAFERDFGERALVLFGGRVVCFCGFNPLCAATSLPAWKSIK